MFAQGPKEESWALVGSGDVLVIVLVQVIGLLFYALRLDLLIVFPKAITLMIQCFFVGLGLISTT